MRSSQNQRTPSWDRLGQVLFDKRAAIIKLLPVNPLPWCCENKPHFLFTEPWKGVGKKCCIPDSICDSGDTPANLMCELNGHLMMPCTSCLCGKWVEDVCTGQFGVFVYFVLRCLLGCCTWFSCCAAKCGAQHNYVAGTVMSQVIGFSLAHGRRLVPSGRWLSSRIRLIGSLTAGIWDRLIALHRMSFK